MAFETGTSSNFNDLRNRIVNFVSGIGPVSISGSGDHTTNNLTNIQMSTSPVDETWTVAVTGTGPVSFSVTGSVSGAQAAASLDVAYDSGEIKFLIQSVTDVGTTSWQIGDTFTFAVTTNAFNVTGEGWFVNRWGLAGSGGASALGHVFLQAPGVSTTDQIFIGLDTLQNVSVPYSNLRLRGATGFDPQELLDFQPGKSPTKTTPLDDTSMPYWLIANGNRLAFTAKVGTVFECGYAGFHLAYGTPEQLPYPLVIAGTNSSSFLQVSDTSANHRAFSDPGNGFTYRGADGVWRDFSNRDSGDNFNHARVVWPLGGLDGQFTNDDHPVLWNRVRDNLDGSYSLYPLILHTDADSRDAYGELDGCYWISGFNNFSENTAVIGPDTYVVFQNIFRTSTNDFWAMRLK